MGIITLNGGKIAVLFRSVCNIFMKKLTTKKMITTLLFFVFASCFVWMLDNIERERFRLRLSKYVTLSYRIVGDRPLQGTWPKKVYRRPNTSIPGVVDDILAMDPPKYMPEFQNPCWYEKVHGNVSQRRCLPYFYLLGVDKCATTDLFSRLLKHPQILRTNAVNSKETHWWSWRRFGYDVFVNDAKIQHFEDYLKIFDSTSARLNKTQVFGDGSPTYFWDFTGWPLIPQNKGQKSPRVFTPHCIKHLTPNAKFIIILRNPVDRLYSDYLFLIRKDASPAKFHEGVLSAMKELSDCEKIHGTRLCLFNKTLHMRTQVRLLIGLYGDYLSEWFKVFPMHQFLIIKTEEYKKDIARHLRAIFKFLELAPLSNAHLNNISSGKHAFERPDHLKKMGPMLPTTKVLLKRFYSKAKLKVYDVLHDMRFIWN